MSEDAAKKLSAADVQAIFDRSPFIAWLGLQIVSLDYERQEVTVRMTMRPELERRPGTRQFHGGPIAAFIDIAGDFAIGMLVGGGVPTMNFRTDYLRPADR
jgi:acyl-coenzyme A thioesterase PaaI-like protein